MFIRLLLVLLPLGLFMFLAQAIPLSPLQSLLLLVPVAVWADKTTVDDQAGLFSQEEEQELTDRIVELTTDWNMDFVVMG